jgi:hypothetical protein
MLKLRDFFHLPQVDEFIGQLISGGPGLRLVAGLDLRQPAGTPSPAGVQPGDFLPSGRATVFWILMEEILAAHPGQRCVVVTEEKGSVRIPRGLKGRIDAEAQPPYEYAGHRSRFQPPPALVVDHLTEKTVRPALAAAQKGLTVLSQIDTVFRGAKVARQLTELGADPESLGGLAWILYVQRMAALCPKCRQPFSLDPAQLTRLRQQHPTLAHLLGDKVGFYQAGGCPECRNTGRQGDIAVFDIFRAQGLSSVRTDQPAANRSLYPAPGCPRPPGAGGFLPFRRRPVSPHLSPARRPGARPDGVKRGFRKPASPTGSRPPGAPAADECLDLSPGHQPGSHHLQRPWGPGSAALPAHLRAVRRRPGYPILPAPEGRAEVLAAVGWDPALILKQLDAAQVFSRQEIRDPAPFSGQPPGVAPEPEAEPLRAGLYVPLIAQDQRVGLMVVQSTQKVRFEPGDTALLQAFAHQAALALQRSGLVDQLWAKIDQLETAQAELARKERMEHEMELARQVQQSVLPTTFPQISGYRFAAQNEPARRVGGDFYDIFALDDGHFGLAVADVSDKGIPAALYMALTRSLLRAEARRVRSPAAVVANVNRLLSELGEAKNFVTLFYGVVTRSARRLTYTRWA